jgi:hypothetical protein
MRALLVLAGIAFILAPAPASAQRWGRERFPQSGACFYRDAYFEGDYFCLRAGDEVARLPDDLNDEISSILIFGRAEVVVFKDIRFRGGSMRFTYSVDDLDDYDWNDRISSMRVQGAERRDRFGDLNDVERGRDRRGEDPDRIVRRAYQDILGRDPDAAGLRQYRSRIIDDGWTEEQVRTSLRNSPEYREKITMTRAKAEEIVRRAYRNILNRDPDAVAEGYIMNVMRNNWSQQDVERELRKSPEYKGDRR